MPMGRRIMKETTLCYLEQDGKYLMLYRNKKPQDPNAGKWIGVGGRLEEGETPQECLVREVREETGLELEEYDYRGKVLFLSDCWEDEAMYLYTSDKFGGEMLENCDEGELKWIPFEEIFGLSLWEGDRIFLRELLAGRRDIDLTLRYEGEKLISAEKNG